MEFYQLKPSKSISIMEEEISIYNGIWKTTTKTTPGKIIKTPENLEAVKRMITMSIKSRGNITRDIKVGPLGYFKATMYNQCWRCHQPNDMIPEEKLRENGRTLENICQIQCN